MTCQKTLKKAFTLEGIGLHRGEKVKITVSPASANHGIVFKRTDLKNSPLIPAKIDFVELSELSTTLVKDGVRVQTIEHLQAALYTKGVDNALIYIDSDELPILDGSARFFFEAINSVGTQDQEQTKNVFISKSTSKISLEEKSISFEPHSEKNLIIDYTIDYPQNKFIGKQQLVFKLTEESFLEIASARTFCLLEDVKLMQSRGLALGGSLNNAIVVDEDKVLNPGGLRFEKEFVKHKILDCIGDLSLLGARIYGKITVYKGGHSLHHKLSQELQNKNN